MFVTRPTAKEAIEALKIHQLRRENVLIFDEITGLRTDVATRQEELLKLQKQIKTIHDDVKKICKTQSDANFSIQCLRETIKPLVDDQAELRQVRTVSKQDLAEVLAASKEAYQKNAAALNVVSEQIKHLQKRVDESEQTNVEAIANVQNGLAGKADKKVISRLEEKFDHFIERIEEKVTAKVSAISRVSESVDLITGHSPGKFCIWFCPKLVTDRI